MAEKYTLNDIFRYEDISKVYIVSEGRQLSPRELVEKAVKEERFDVDYAYYLHFKHKHQVTEFIKRRNRCIGNSLQFIDTFIGEGCEAEFELKIKAMPFKIKPTVFDILDVLIRDQQWDLVFYVYYREVHKFHEFIDQMDSEHIPLNPIPQNNNILDKKMVILQA